MRIKLRPPPGIDISVRCIECVDLLPVGELLTLETLRDLIRHIHELDHEIVVSARKKVP